MKSEHESFPWLRGAPFSKHEKRVGWLVLLTGWHPSSASRRLDAIRKVQAEINLYG